MLCLLAMLLIAQSFTAMVTNVSSAPDTCNETRSSKAESSTKCSSRLTDTRGSIYYDIASSQHQRYCDYLIDSGRSDVKINISKFHLSETCGAEYVTIECINENCTVLTPPYCKSGGPSPILLRSCYQVRIVLHSQDISRASPCGQFAIEYAIGQNYDDSIPVFDAKRAAYKYQADNTVIEHAAKKVKKPTEKVKKAKKMIRLSASLLDNINFLLGLHRRALSSCEAISRRTRGTLARHNFFNYGSGGEERVERVDRMKRAERADGNVIKWTPFLLWTTLMSKLLGDMFREMF